MGIIVSRDSGPRRRRESTETTASDDKENSASYPSVSRENDAKVLGVSGQILKPTEGTAGLSALSAGSQKENPGVFLNSKRLKDGNKPPLIRSKSDMNSNRINNPRDSSMHTTLRRTKSDINSNTINNPGVSLNSKRLKDGNKPHLIRSMSDMNSNKINNPRDSSMHTIVRRTKSDINSNTINNPQEQLDESSMHTIVSQVSDLLSKIDSLTLQVSLLEEINTDLSSESGSENTVKTSHDTLTSTHGGKKSTTRSNYVKLIDTTMKELEEKYPIDSPQNDPYYGENVSLDCPSSSTEAFENLLKCMNSKLISVEPNFVYRNCKYCDEKYTAKDHEGHDCKKCKTIYLSQWEPVATVLIEWKQNKDSSWKVTSKEFPDNLGKSKATVKETPSKNNAVSISGTSMNKTIRMSVAKEPGLKFTSPDIASTSTHSDDSAFLFSENSPDVNIVTEEKKRRQSTQKTKLQMQEKGKRVLNKSRDNAENGPPSNSILCTLSERIIKMSTTHMWYAIRKLSKSCMVLESSFIMRMTSRLVSDCVEYRDPFYFVPTLEQEELQVKTAVKLATLCIRHIAKTNSTLNALNKSFKEKGENSKEEYEGEFKFLLILQEELGKTMKRMDAANKSLAETIVYYTGKPEDILKQLKRKGGRLTL